MTFTLRAIDARIVDLPIRRRHRIGVAVMNRQSSVVVRAFTDDGIVGLGEGTTPGGGPAWGGESVETIKAIIDAHLAPALCGRELSGPNEVHAILQRVSARSHAAKAALEMASWDILGKQLDCSVAELMGGRQRRELEVVWSIGADTPEPVNEFNKALDDGHQIIKFMIGAYGPRADVARIVDVLRHAHRQVTVMVDPNATWTEADARRWLPMLFDAGVDIVEQPVAAWNRAGLARLRAATPLQIMADEGLQSTHDALALVGDGSADLFAVKVPKLGGLGPARDVAGIARGAGIRCYGGGTMETSIGTAAAAQLYSTWPDIGGCDLIGPLLLEDDVVSTPVSYVDGRLQVPTGGAGLGVELDEKKIDQYGRK
jgi:muconate cycloisomerase